MLDVSFQTRSPKKQETGGAKEVEHAGDMSVLGSVSHRCKVGIKTLLLEVYAIA